MYVFALVTKTNTEYTVDHCVYHDLYFWDFLSGSGQTDKGNNDRRGLRERERESGD